MSYRDALRAKVLRKMHWVPTESMLANDLPKGMIVRLLLEGTQLDAEDTLAHYQITAGCQLHAPEPHIPNSISIPSSFRCMLRSLFENVNMM